MKVKRVMGQQAIDLGQQMLMEVLRIAGPVLAIAVVVSLLINIVQVLTSLQDTTIATVPRLLAAAGGIFFMMPWMWRHLEQFTWVLLSDFRPYIR
jgi:flagellar biosynthesis protein FliQ